MVASQAPTPISADRSQAEIQKMLRTEIDTLRKLLDERLTEILALTSRLEETAPVRSPDHRLAEQEQRHQMQITLLHALYASWNRGPASGVLPFAQQIGLLDQTDLFDAPWYLATYPDVRDSGLSPAEHYVRSGAFEGRNPGPNFTTMAYYLANPDVAQAGWPALVHYAGFGRAEGRRIG